MFTIVALIGFLCLILFVRVRHKTSFPRLARTYLWLAPFVPLISVVNHNLDGDYFGPLLRVLPLYVVIGLLVFSLTREKTWSLGIEGLFLALYAAISLVQIPFTVDPLWALFTWSWSVPGYFLFLIAGHGTSTTELANEKYAVWAVLGYLAINIGLIFYGLVSGRVTDLFYTRNFGSIYGSTAMLTFLVLYAGMAWLRARSSVWEIYLLVGASAVAIVLSLSRTALAVVAVYFSYILMQRPRQVVKLIVGIGLVGVSLGLAIRLGNPEWFSSQIASNWAARFDQYEIWNALSAAWNIRLEVFASVRESILTGNPFSGVGFGNFLTTAGVGYPDAHNLFFTEAYENGLVAALFLFVFLAFGVARSLVMLFRLDKDRLPLAVSVLGFLLIAHTTGGVLSQRGLDAYFTPYFGWALSFLIGCLAHGKREAATGKSGLTSFKSVEAGL